MTAKGGHSDDNLLELIATKERELEAQVAQARDEARRMVDGTRAKVAAVQEQARREAAAHTERVQADTAKETAAISAQRAEAARTETERVRARAAEHAPQAVDLVVKRVLGGLE